jgi:hypothetical protein
MIVAALLYLLASVDATLLGYSAASGRNALIRKGAYYRRAMGWGWLLGQGAILISGALGAAILAHSADRDALWSDVQRTGTRMLWVYLPFALVIATAFAFRAIPHVDIRSMTSTIIFGPLTFVRPLVGAAGLAFGIAAAPRAEIIGMGTLVLAMMLSLEYVLGGLFRRRPP